MGTNLYYFCAFLSALSSRFGCSLASDDFCYMDRSCGPESAAWGGACQNGDRQSPIALPYHAPSTVKPGDEVIYMFPPGSARLHLRAYAAASFRMKNTGNTVLVEPLDKAGSPKNKVIGLSIYHLPNVFEPTDYRLDTISFHWGPHDWEGSEHAFDGGRVTFAMEIQFLHFRARYTSTEQALAADDPKALAVVGVFLNTTSDSSDPGNVPLAPIVNNLPKVVNPSNDWTLVNEELDLTPLLPHDHNSDTFTYNGSLTTPNCEEKVLWYMYRIPSAISMSDVKQFRTMKRKDGTPLKNNFRPLHSKRGRRVYSVPMGGWF